MSEIDEIRACLAAHDIGALPNDYPTLKLAEDRMTDWRRMRDALEKIERAPAWGAPETWEATPAEVRQLARKALST